MCNGMALDVWILIGNIIVHILWGVIIKCVLNRDFVNLEFNLCCAFKFCVINDFFSLYICSAENYMETTEGENWASNLISNLNSRYPTGIDTQKVSLLLCFFLC